MKLNKLNVGCGKDIRKGYINLDIIKSPGVNVVHDLNSFPYPFKENSFDEILALQIIEHLDNPLRFLEELHRISRPGALIHIETPHHASGNAYGDITHRNFFNFSAFASLADSKKFISNEEIKSKKFNFSLKEGKIELVRFHFLEGIINKIKKAYDYGICYILRPVNMRIVFTVIKNS